MENKLSLNFLFLHHGVHDNVLWKLKKKYQTLNGSQNYISSHQKKCAVNALQHLCDGNRLITLQYCGVYLYL